MNRFETEKAPVMTGRPSRVVSFDATGTRRIVMSDTLPKPRSADEFQKKVCSLPAGEARSAR